MKLVKALAPVVAALVLGSCSSGGGAGWDPIVLDLSITKTPTPAGTAVASMPPPTTTPVPVAAAVPTVAPSPRPAPAPTAAPPAVAPAQPMPSPPAVVLSPESVVQNRIAAYNRQDLEALVALYAPDARIFDPPDKLRDSGQDQIRQDYARRFASGSRGLISVTSWMTEGNKVVSREIETAGGHSDEMIVTSEVRDGKLVRVWIVR